MQDKVVYLTPEGKERFVNELRELQTVRRHEVEERIRRAKEFSDTVDNAEYDEAKTEQGFVEGRIQDLERMLASARMIEEPHRADYVRMGSHIKVVDSEGDEQTYYLVGSQDEPGACERVDIRIHKNNWVTVSDRGRGIPVDKHPRTGKSAAVAASPSQRPRSKSFVLRNRAPRR